MPKMTMREILSTSPKNKKEAANGKNKDNRCAASALVIPAILTALPITIKIVGNKIPSAIKIGASETVKLGMI